MKNLILILTLLLGLSGCSHRFFSDESEVSLGGTCSIEECSSNISGKEEVARFQTQCDPCFKSSRTGFSKTILNGYLYKSDISFNCCPDRRALDSSSALKKVYIHKILDLRESQKIVQFIYANKKTNLHTAKRFNLLLYKALKNELHQRGVILVDTPSVYRIKLDFELTELNSIYRKNTAKLNSKLFGELTLKTMGKIKKYNISTTQSVGRLDADNADDLGVFIDLLVKQMANKIAFEVVKF